MATTPFHNSYPRFDVMDLFWGSRLVISIILVDAPALLNAHSFTVFALPHLHLSLSRLSETGESCSFLKSLPLSQLLHLVTSKFLGWKSQNFTFLYAGQFKWVLKLLASIISFSFLYMRQPIKAWCIVHILETCTFFLIIKYTLIFPVLWANAYLETFKEDIMFLCWAYLCPRLLELLST